MILSGGSVPGARLFNQQLDEVQFFAPPPCRYFAARLPSISKGGVGSSNHDDVGHYGDPAVGASNHHINAHPIGDSVRGWYWRQGHQEGARSYVTIQLEENRLLLWVLANCIGLY